eukprot:UN31645
MSWQQEWMKAARSATIVLCLISENYCKSRACLTEFTIAGNLDKRLEVIVPGEDFKALQNLYGDAMCEFKPIAFAEEDNIKEMVDKIIRADWQTTLCDIKYGCYIRSFESHGISSVEQILDFNLHEIRRTLSITRTKASEFLTQLMTHVHDWKPDIHLKKIGFETKE